MFFSHVFSHVSFPFFFPCLFGGGPVLSHLGVLQPPLAPLRVFVLLRLAVFVDLVVLVVLAVLVWTVRQNPEGTK